MKNSKEVDSLETDGSFTHKEVIRKGLDHPYNEVDSSNDRIGRFSGINRYGEINPEPVLGREGEPPGISHFEHDPDYSWSKDPRSESSSEAILHREKDEDELRDNEFVLYQIRSAFSSRDDIDVTRLEMKVDGGIIFISGELNTEEEAKILDRIINEVCGITGVMNTVSVKPEQDLHRGILGHIEDPGGPIKGMH